MVFFTSIFLFLSACGGGSGDGTPEEMELEEDLRQSFVEFFGAEGNIWKPRADPISSGAGNLVVLLSPKYPTRFDSCEVPLLEGGVGQLLCIDYEPWTQVPFSCLSNGGRQTWRANFTCDKAAIVEVTCRDAAREVVFTVPDAALNAVCSRFG